MSGPEEKRLIRISDLTTHFYEVDVGKVMILGCHDLKMFDPRQYKRKNMTSWRKNIIKEFHLAAKDKKPTLVLQHPHSTVKIRTWNNAWIYLRKEVIPSVEKYASAGRYYEESKKSEYDTLDKVLNKTKYCYTIDFIVQPIEENKVLLN
jgi:hypothetical protein